jgi:hypothetical protein
VNWDRAKNLTILFLCIINIFLASIVFFSGTNYSLSSYRQNTINTLLAKSNISMYTNIIRDYRPLSPILLEPFIFDEEELLKIFFAEADFAYTTQANTNIYNGTNSQLVVYPGRFVYQNTSNEITNINIEDFKDSYLINYFYDIMPNLFLDNIFIDETGFILNYRQKYNNFIIHTNYVNIHLFYKDLLKIEASYSKPIGFNNYEASIISPDNAIFILMNYLNNQYSHVQEEIFINTMDIVFFASAYNPSIAVPHYRFYTSVANNAILINAVTSELFEH